MKNTFVLKHDGSILIIVLIMLIVLAFIASTSMMNSVTNLKISANYSKSIGVFNLAEEGLARAKLLAKNATNFDDLLNTTTYPGGVLIPTTTDTDGTFTVKVANNITGANPDSGGATNDTDGIIVLTSTAYGKLGNKVEIESYVGRPTTVVFSPTSAGAGHGAIGLCGVGPNITNTGNSLISGYDYALNGSKVTPNTGTYGIVSQTALSAISQTGNTSVTGYLGQFGVDPNMDCTQWANLGAQLAALGAGPNVQIITSNSVTGNITWGTTAAPKITIINTASATFSITGNFSGAGIIVVTGNVTLSMTGNSSFTGVIVLMGTNAALKDTGNQSTLGYIIVNSAIQDTAQEIQTTGNSSLRYSTAAMAIASNAINGAGAGGGSTLGTQLLTYSWSERY